MVVRTKKNGRRIVAEEEFDDVDVDVDVEDVVDEGEVDVAPEADGLLFEAQDVAELVAEITGEAVAVDSEDAETVVFTVGEDEFTVSAEGDEEILEACGTKKSVKSSRDIRRPATRRPIKSSRPVARPTTRSDRPATRRPVSSKTPVQSSRTVRKIPTKR